MDQDQVHAEQLWRSTERCWFVSHQHDTLIWNPGSVFFFFNHLLDDSIKDLKKSNLIVELHDWIIIHRWLENQMWPIQEDGSFKNRKISSYLTECIKTCRLFQTLRWTKHLLIISPWEAAFHARARHPSSSLPARSSQVRRTGWTVSLDRRVQLSHTHTSVEPLGSLPAAGLRSRKWNRPGWWVTWLKWTQWPLGEESRQEVTRRRHFGFFLRRNSLA